MYVYIYVKYRYSCQILMKFDLSRQIFKKYPNIKFHENPFTGSPVVPRGEMGRHDEAKSYSLQFCEHA